jgi:hypothetical protein
MAEIDFFFPAVNAALESGLLHKSQVEPYDPAPYEPVKLFFSTNALIPIERIAVYYTTNGEEPSGLRGVSTDSSVVSTVSKFVEQTWTQRSCRPSPCSFLSVPATFQEASGSGDVLESM